jgi:transcriptional regulator with GAF, ATPase, and Fis domain
MTKNEFFRKMTIKICGNLDIEKALFSSLTFLKDLMPVTILFLEYYDVNMSATRTIAKATLKGGQKVDLLTPLSQEAKQWASGYLSDISKQAYLYQDPMDRPYASEMMRFHNITLCSVILLPLEAGGKVIGSLIVGSEGKTKFNKKHAELISLMSEPIAIAMSNALIHREVVQLKNNLTEDNKQLHNELRRLSGEEIIGANLGLKEVMEKAGQVASLDSPVLLLGETGVGKDVIANAIHYSSSRADGPFVKLNCGAIPETLIDSQLFGHEKGAFTGAFKSQRGCFERAVKGTVFLDEIGELPLNAQTRLLRVLQDKEIVRVGGEKIIPLDIRIIFATNNNLEEMVKDGRFREDLWFRLNVFPIWIPPLRHRRSDIPELVQYFIDVKSKELKLPSIPKVEPYSLDSLFGYEWPGNVRELANIVERELILNPKGPLNFKSLGPLTRQAMVMDSKPESTILSLNEMMVIHIRQALTLSNGKIHGKGGAAELLNINPNTLRSKIRKFGIQI